MSDPKLVVLTGGPGAGKTAVLEMLRRLVCAHVCILPEAAGVLFTGGFTRGSNMEQVKAAQRAIYHVQRELENIAIANDQFKTIVCDRGTLDGLAYWPNHDESFFKELGISREQELARYDKVIHLRTPTLKLGYNKQNPNRTETAEQASKIDERIVNAWSGHPNRHYVNNSHDFFEKAHVALELVIKELPQCCSERALLSELAR
ncbi:MAG TPA: ATP-binding protein [Bdellovibrionales bacterium]|nr:ATP-binding protein [Bdellovibrionales bacterium]